MRLKFGMILDKGENMKKKSFIDWLWNFQIKAHLSPRREGCSYQQYKDWDIDGRVKNHKITIDSSCSGSPKAYNKEAKDERRKP